MLNRLLRFIIGIICFITFPILLVVHLLVWVIKGKGFMEELSDWITGI